MSELNHDLVVIGAGPGGYVAAIHAAQEGLKVAIVEARALGGVCLQAGCIPTKTMLAGADAARMVRQAAAFGIKTGPEKISYSAMFERQKRVINQFTQGIQYLLEKNQVEIIIGRAFLKSGLEVEVYDYADKLARTLANPGAILLATGSHAADLPMLKRDGVRVLNSSDALNLTAIPQELIIVGGGYIGCEFASLFNTLGSRVTIIEAMDRLLPNMDRDLGTGLKRALAKSGVTILCNARIAEAENGERILLKLADGQVVAGDRALVAVGRNPNLENLGLENAGLKCSEKGIEVNDSFQTSAPHIHAIGDVTGHLALAHVASAQGRRVVNHLLRSRRPDLPPPLKSLDYDCIPACVYTHPEIASVGLTEEAASQRGTPVRAGRFPFAALGKAAATGETDGFIKLLADAQTGKLLGGHIFGPHATELIGQVALAMQWGINIHQLAETVFAHPTLGEAIGEAAEALCGKPTHIIVRK